MPKRVSTSRAVRTSLKTGNWASLARASRVRRKWKRGLIREGIVARLQKQVRSITSTIETKSGVWACGNSGMNLAHNNITIVTSPGNGQPGDRLNMFQINQGIQDNMGSGQVNNRIGDKITVSGVMIRAMFENELNRPKVFYRLMILKCAKGDVPTRDLLFQRNSPNKMIDQINTERYSIIASKRFTISSSNPTASLASIPAGEPQELEVGGLINAGMGTKMVSMWVPGRKFFRNGICQYNCSFPAQNDVTPKFFDFYVVCMAYDWIGTPQDVNNVGKINSLYTKLYFKDA